MKHTLPIILLALVLVTACHSDQRQLARLHRAQTLIDTAPDTALVLLDSIDSHRLMRADNALYALLMSQALDKNYIDITNDSLINIAVEYYEKHGNHRYRGMAYYYKATTCYNIGKYEEAIELLVKAEESLLKTDYYNMIALTYNLLSEIYIEQYRLTNAIDFSKKAYSYYKKCNNWENLIYCLLRQANVLMVESPTDSILPILDKAHLIATEQNCDELLFLVENYRATLYEYNKEYDKAKAIIKNALNQYPAHISNADDYLLLSRIYLNSGNADSALYFLDYGYEPLCKTYSDNETLYLLKSDIYSRKQDYNNAYKYLDKYISSVTESGLLEQNNSINELEKKYRTQIIEQKSQVLKMRNSYLTIISILALLLAILFLFLYRRQKQMRIAQYYQLHESAQQNIAKIQHQYDNIKRLLNTQSAQKKLYENTLKSRIEMLNTLIELTDIYESRKNDFYDKCRSYINICNKNETSFFNDIRDIASLYVTDFVKTLQNQFPTLSDEEINLCCLTLLGFDINHIRILFNHSNIQSTYSKRTRLRKKLGLNSDENIRNFLLSLSTKS